MRHRPVLVQAVLLLVLVSGALLALDGRETGARAAASETLPGQALILGVPFVSWEDAARSDYHEKNILNPSIAAAYYMVLEYWGESRDRLNSKDPFEKQLPDWVVAYKEGASVADLKDLVAQGIPVLVSLPLTPYGHPLYLTFEIAAKTGMVRGITLVDKGRPRPGILGRIVSLEELANPAWDTVGTKPIRESVLSAKRVVVGYDDRQKHFVVMDPTFGPGFEIGYEDFAKMWNVAGNSLFALHPRDYRNAAAKAKGAGPYRPPSPREQAAKHYVYGYALDSTGQLERGEQEFKAGLTVPSLAKGYRCLLEFELALNYGERGMWDDALVAAEVAASAVPEYPDTWSFLSGLYRIHPGKMDLAKSRKFAALAETLSKDKNAQLAVARAFPNDFLILPLGNIRKDWVGPRGSE